VTRKDQLAFIEKIAPAARASQSAHGVPASVIIAQAILESGWGQHAPGNNFFGIKKGALNAPYIESRTNLAADSEKRAKFRSFDSVRACFNAHGILLSTDPRYQGAMADTGNPIVFATRLRDCGYSEDPGYGKKLVKLMADFKLMRFDRAG
jgi:flagellum-specific peptidoglycan hydrolase FlgJ